MLELVDGFNGLDEYFRETLTTKCSFLIPLWKNHAPGAMRTSDEREMVKRVRLP
jgi:hypothetical protein